MITQTCIWDELRVSNEKNKSIKLLNESTRNYSKGMVNENLE